MAESNSSKGASKAKSRKAVSLDALLMDKVKPQKPFSGVLISYRPKSGWSRELGDQSVLYTAVLLFIVLLLWILSVINPLGLMGQGVIPEFDPNQLVRRGTVFPVQDFSVPESGLVVLEPTYVVSGRVVPGMGFLIDGQAVSIDESGAFSQAVPLLPQENLIHFTVTDGEKRISSVREIIYQTDANSLLTEGTLEERVEEMLNEDIDDPLTDSLELSVTVFPEAATLTLTLDKQQQAPITLSAGGSYRWTASESIVISTSNAASTVLYLNRQPIGVMGDRPKEASQAFTWSDVK